MKYNGTINWLILGKITNPNIYKYTEQKEKR